MYTLQNYSTMNIYLSYKINPKGRGFQLHFSVWQEFQTDCLFQNQNKPFEASTFLEYFFLDNNHLVKESLDSSALSVLCKVESYNSKSVYLFSFSKPNNSRNICIFDLYYKHFVKNAIFV